MAELTAALNDALSGHGRLVILAGEPGIGKTRTATELASYAESRGANVLWGWCYEQEGAPPYWPWVQTIRSYVQQCDAERLRSEMGPGVRDIAEVVALVRDKLIDLEPPPVLEPEQARFRLFDSITTFLKRACQAQPLVFVLDDLHWADRSTLLLLEYLAQEILTSRLLIVGTYRDVEITTRDALSQTLGNLVRQPLFMKVQLQGLARQEVGEFVQASAGITLADDALGIMHRRTEGNPLFVTEITRLFGPEQISEDQAWVETIPEGVRDVIGRRLSRLSEPCVQALRIASVIGRNFDFKLLNSLFSDISEDRLLEAIDEAQAAHVVDEVTGTVEQYQFSHALIQQTLSQELTVSRRVRIHARIGEALEGLRGNNSNDHAAELAYHFGEAEPVVGAEKVVYYSRVAGEQDLAVYAHEEALSHFQRALAARNVPLTATEEADNEESAALLFGLGRAQIGLLPRYQMREAVANLARSFSYYVQSGDLTSAVSVAAFPIPLVHGFSTGKAELVARALELVPEHSVEAGRLLSGLGGLIGSEAGDYHGAHEALDRALAIARREGDLPLELRTLLSFCQVDLVHLRRREGIDSGLLAIALAERLGAHIVEQIARTYTGGAASALGELKELYGHVYAPELVDPDKVDGRDGQALIFFGLSLVRYWEGDWQACREVGDRGLKLLPMDPQLLGVRVLLEYQAGELAAGEANLNKLLDGTRLTMPGPTNNYAILAMVAPAFAQFADLSDKLDRAEEAAKMVLSSPVVLPLMAFYAQTGLAFIELQKGDVAAAKQRYDSILTQKGQLLGWLISADRLLGLLAQTMGELELAATHFEEALAFCRNAACRPELAWTCCNYAELKLHHPSPPERMSGTRTAPTDKVGRASATALLEEGKAIASEVGMRPLLERIATLQETAAAAPKPSPTYPNGLTQREVEVLLQLAQGKTNREIARELVLSERTIERHISNFYTKINVRNRSEATTFALNNLANLP